MMDGLRFPCGCKLVESQPKCASYGSCDHKIGHRCKGENLLNILIEISQLPSSDH